MKYPDTQRVEVVDEQFGTKIADPYRWLENDIRRDPDVAAWVDAQDAVARAYLAKLPGREMFRERLTALFDHERFTAPNRKGGHAGRTGSHPGGSRSTSRRASGNLSGP